MIKNIYLVRDLVSHVDSELSIAPSDSAAERSFGLQLESSGVDKRLASDLMLVQVGTIDYGSGLAYPTISGHPTPYPVCSGRDALEYVSHYNERMADDESHV